MTLLIIISVVILIMFIPLPLFLTFIYEENKLAVYVYNIKVHPSEKTKNTVKKPKSNTMYPKALYIRIIKHIYRKSNHTLFKSSLKFKCNILYGLDDACATALLYGVLNSTLQCFYHLFSELFRVKDFDIDITPKFNKSIFKLKVNSIIFINLAKIIYIVYLIYISFKKGSKKYLRPKEVI